MDVNGTIRSNAGSLVFGTGGYLTNGGAHIISNSNNLNYLKLDGSTIQAERSNGAITGSTAQPLVLNKFGGNVGIQTTTPNATLSVARGTGGDGTAAFLGSQHVSHFNYSTGEDTYIRGGKTGSAVYINDSHNGDVNIGGGGGTVNIGSTGNINLGNTGKVNVGPGGMFAAQTGNLNLVPLGIVEYFYKVDDIGNLLSMTIINKAGNLATGVHHFVRISNDEHYCAIQLNTAVISQYSSITAIGSPNYSCFNTYVINLQGQYDPIGYNANYPSLLLNYRFDDVSSVSGAYCYGTFIIYGVK
jgi:hypothetical protein